MPIILRLIIWGAASPEAVVTVVVSSGCDSLPLQAKNKILTANNKYFVIKRYFSLAAKIQNASSYVTFNLIKWGKLFGFMKIMSTFVLTLKRIFPTHSH